MRDIHWPCREVRDNAGLTLKLQLIVKNFSFIFSAKGFVEILGTCVQYDLCAK